ncbi:hypothetical protein PAXRUDRAFT_34717 [Paxillus rubicundulus Ve08.2h10]|uniref:Uncharacterized protein n=1 Tax=Paxillus rubicundulus Ve08.2h10 TaxID=930991 RepID=A0A0D0DL71_9AGAM|nr:hypothetical protein PAXRUDRAFT_34717 [Paxillus rubicundulus Ve08.2h10]
MFQHLNNIPTGVWDQLPDRTKAAIAASQVDERGGQAIDLRLTSSAPRRPHDTYSDGPSAPYPYMNRSGDGREVNETELHTSLYDEDAEDMTENHNKLSMAGQEARSELNCLVTTKFRFACNVPEGGKWPSVEEWQVNAETGETWLTPNFNTTTITQSEFLHDRKIKWNKLSLYEFAKETYHGFKPDWKAQNDPEKMAQKSNHQQENRWMQCHKDKAAQLMTVREVYMDKHGVDPCELVHEGHMSHEASGPEGDEPWGSWKRRMAMQAGVSEDVNLESISFEPMEVMQSPWRSSELSSIFHDMGDLWWVSLSAKQKKRFQTVRVWGTDCMSKRIPEWTPYNFGINMEWLVWGNWEDPDGFRSKAHQVLGGPSGKANNMNNDEE